MLLRSAKRCAGLLAVWLACTHSVSAQQAVDVALAGFAYSGAASTIEQRFPYSLRYENDQLRAGTPIGQQLLTMMTTAPPRNVRIVPQLEQLKGRSQALATALVIGAETVSAEQFGQVHKLTVLIRGQAMFFDFKSMNVVRSYPVSFAYIDALDHAPKPEEILARVKLVYQGVDGKPGLLARFAASVGQAEIPAHVPRFLQVTSAKLAPEALDTLPAYIKSEPGAAETWAADLVGEAISTRAGVPIVPYAKGYAIGNVMSMRISDGRREDTQQICGRVVVCLAEAFGSDAVFFDLDKIHPGQDFLGVITQALANCEVQVLLIGPRWRQNAKRLSADGDVVRLEIETAIAGGLEVIPVLVDGAPFPTAKELPAALLPLLRRNALHLSSGPAFQADVNRLVAAVKAQADSAAHQHPPGPWPEERWSLLPQPAMEAVTALAQDGADTYAACLLQRRILRRDSVGRNWVTFADLPDTGPPKCIAVARSVRGRAVWVGTESQLLRSEGVLSGWHAHPRFASLDDRGVRSIAVDPIDPLRILVGTGRYSGGTTFAAATAAGQASEQYLEEDWTDDVGAGDLHVSRDGGATWRTGPFRNVNRVVLAPGDTRKVYVATADDGVFVSPNGGAAFTRTTGSNFQTLWALAVSPHDPETVAIGTRGAGTWLSQDGGLSFQKLNAGGDVDTLAIAFDSDDPGAVVVGTDKGLYESTDGGATFARADQGLVHWRVLAAQYAAHGTLVVGTDGGGIYERRGRGAPWTRTWVRGERSGCGALAIGTAGAVYVGAGGALCVTDNEGRAFDTLLHLPRSTIRAAAALADPPPRRGAPRTVGWGREQTLLVGTEDGEIHRSDDYGARWHCVHRSSRHRTAVRRIVGDDHGALYTVTQMGNVLKSSDRGQTWLALPAPPAPPTAIAFAQPAHVLVVGTYDAGVFFSRDDGATWHSLGTGLRDQPVMALHLVDTSRGVRVLAGQYGGGIHWLEESTPRWQRATGPGRINVFDLAEGAMRLFAAAEDGVWTSTDAGLRWQHWVSGMQDFDQVTRVAVTADGGCIFAGTNRGVFVRRLRASPAMEANSR